MNAVTAIEAGQAKSASSSHAAEFHFLCGQMTRHYARVEADVVRAIDRLDPDGKIPPMLSSRTARLSLLIDRRSDAPSKGIAKALIALQPHLDRRNILIHGVGTVASRPNNWLWPWEVRAGSKAIKERSFWTDVEMREYQSDLKSKCDRLHSYVDRLCQNICGSE